MTRLILLKDVPASLDPASPKRMKAEDVGIVDDSPTLFCGSPILYAGTWYLVMAVAYDFDAGEQKAYIYENTKGYQLQFFCDETGPFFINASLHVKRHGNPRIIGN